MLVQSKSSLSHKGFPASYENMIGIETPKVVRPSLNSGISSTHASLKMVKPISNPSSTIADAHPIPKLSLSLNPQLTMSSKPAREDEGEEPLKPSFRPPPKRQQQQLASQALTRPEAHQLGLKLQRDIDGQKITEFLSDRGAAAILPCPGEAGLPRSCADALSSLNGATSFSPCGDTLPVPPSFPSPDAATLAGAWIRRLVDLKSSEDGPRKEQPGHQVCN